MKKNDAKLSETEKVKVDFERQFLSKHIDKFYKILDSIDAKGEYNYYVTYK